MEPVTKLTSRPVVLPIANIDTDQIIPARFLTVTTKDGMGANLFADWRSDADFVLNDPTAKSSTILVTGDNFGCGSSREHAPWALVDFGFRAVVSTSIADIFKNNAVKNGLVPVEIDDASHAAILATPKGELSVDLETMTLTLPGGSTTSFPLDAFARHCLLNGLDQLDFLRQQEDAITAYESR